MLNLKWPELDFLHLLLKFNVSFLLCADFLYGDEKEDTWGVPVFVRRGVWELLRDLPLQVGASQKHPHMFHYLSFEKGLEI